MIARYCLSHRPFILGFTTFITALLIAQGVTAQRPSVAEMQAQIDALTHPYDEPAAQVRTTLDILPVFQEAVAKTYFRTGVAPVNRTMAGLSPEPYDTQTSFIENVDINDGDIVVEYGNDADPTLLGRRLVFSPYVSADSTVLWRCGDNPINGNVSRMYGSSSSVTSNIPASAYPNPCILKSQAGGPDETVAAQARTALDIVPAFMDAVAKTYLETGTAPVNREVAGLSPDATDTQTSYIAAVDINNGDIVVRYGNYANALLAVDGVLVFQPYVSVDNTIVWRCGNNPIVAGVIPMPGSYSSEYTTLDGRYTPRPCILKAYASGVDETLNAQVLEPFDVVASFQEAVEAAGAALGTPSEPIAPANREEAGLSSVGQDTVGLYFESVDIVDGAIVVEYGNLVNAMLAGRRLMWTPWESVDGTIVWTCGYVQPVPGIQPMGTASGGNTAGPNYTDISPMYLPSQCRDY